MARVIFITQAVDIHEPVLATVVDWVCAIARDPHVEHLTVLALGTGTFNLPANARVIGIRGRTQLGTLFNFYKYVIPRLFTTDFFFVHMGGAYPLMLWPFKLLFGKPIYQWKTHTYVSPMMKFYARFCDTLIFTATNNSFPYPLSKVRVVGHGTNVDRFKPLPLLRDADLCTVGRLTHVKRLEKILRVLEQCRIRFGVSYQCNLYGPVEDKDQKYIKNIQKQIVTLDLQSYVYFLGTIPQTELPAILNRHKLFISFNAGGLDKAVLEALACGIPVVTPNICVADILPPHLKPLLIFSEDDVGRQAEMVHALMTLTPEAMVSLGKELREIVVRDHSIATLIGKIMKHIYSNA